MTYRELLSQIGKPVSTKKTEFGVHRTGVLKEVSYDGTPWPCYVEWLEPEIGGGWYGPYDLNYPELQQEQQ